MPEVNFDPFPVLTTARLLLRQKTLDDVNEVFFLRSDERVMRYIDRPRAKTAQEAIDFIERINNLVTTKEAVTWGIALKGDPKLIGNIGLWQIDNENHRSKVGYALHPDHHRQGIMDEALKAVLAYGFETMRLHSIEATTNPENTASQKLLEKNNFVREAYFKENYFFDGKFLDSVVYSLITPVK